jgi:hypothetical protein
MVADHQLAHRDAVLVEPRDTRWTERRLRFKIAHGRDFESPEQDVSALVVVSGDQQTRDGLQLPKKLSRDDSDQYLGQLVEEYVGDFLRNDGGCGDGGCGS